MNNTIVKEACVDSLEQCIAAEKNGANRVELCAELNLEGTTPNKELIKACKKQLTIPIMVMIRPRGGNFTYSEEELELMKNQIEFCKKQNVAGVVFGCLNKDNRVDIESTSILANHAHPLEVCFHKAIDDSENILADTKELTKLNSITRILSSGGEKTALEGKEVINKMVEICKNKITIQAAGKITNKNLDFHSKELKCKEFHGKLIVGNLQ